MRFIHIADVHFDLPYTTLETRGLANQRRLEARAGFKKVIDYIRTNDIPYLFICGDLYEQSYVKQSTIEYINKLFEQIPDTKIFIIPGNHDPYIKNSYYRTYKFADNVKIFTSNIERIAGADVDIYGFGFDDFYMRDQKVHDLHVQDPTKINILLTHGDLDSAKNNDMRYNSIPKTLLKSLGFDYVALGHIHKPTTDGNIVYPGSLISLGFDELGEHGMILGDIDEQTKELTTEFIRIDEKQFTELELNITDVTSQEELIERINELTIPDDTYAKILLTGTKQFEINNLTIMRQITNPNIIKIKEKLSIAIDIESLARQNNLKGIFVRTLMEKMEKEPENREKIEKAISIGLSVF